MKTEKTVKKMIESAIAEERDRSALLGKTNTNVLIGGMAVITVMTAAISNIRTKKVQETVRSTMKDGIEQMKDDFNAAYGYGYTGYEDDFTEEEVEEAQSPNPNN